MRALREFEAARLTIARVNGCLFCLHYRTERDGEKVDSGFFDEVSAWRTSTTLEPRVGLAAEYAERFATEHHGLDEELVRRALGPEAVRQKGAVTRPQPA